MSDDTVLSRLLRAGDDEKKERPGRVTPARMLRTAMARAADGTVGLGLTVLGVADETTDLEAAVARAGDENLIFALTRLGETIGYAALDSETRSALVEVQTLGHLREVAGPGRPYTAGDVELSRPLLDAVLREIRCLAHDTPLDGWTNGVSCGPRLSSARSLSLALGEGRYRTVDLTLDFGVGERQGRALLSLPVPRKSPKTEAPTPSESFASALRESVLDAPARLHAVLHRVRLPLAEVEAFEVGRIIAMPGVTVSSVRLEGPGQEELATARLGQVSGLRAIRLEKSASARLTDVPLADPARPTDPPRLPGGPTPEEPET